VRLESSIREVTLVRSSEKDADEKLAEIPVSGGGGVDVVDTQQPGNYQLVWTGAPPADGDSKNAVVDRFAINLFDAQESRLSAKADVELGYETVAAADVGIETRREYWRVLLMLALAVLLGEWWLYTRRLS
jgi:hypothetical protein